MSPIKQLCLGIKFDWDHNNYDTSFKCPNLVILNVRTSFTDLLLSNFYNNTFFKIEMWCGNTAVLFLGVIILTIGDGVLASSPAMSLSTHPQDQCGEDKLCPPGLFCNESSCVCAKGYPRDLVKCNGNSLLALDCVCVTLEKKTNSTFVGGCVFKCGVPHKNALYRPLHNDPDLCALKGRAGTLCGECLPDHYPLAYSFSFDCIKCDNIRWNWFRYVMAAFIPLTLFSFFILFFKINTTSGHINVVICVCQSLSIPVWSRLFLNALQYTSAPNLFIKSILSVYGIWNLDFFRPFYSDLCLGIGILPTMALDYVIAVYPLLLMIISYLLIVLYDRNYRVVTIMWRPFRLLFSIFRRHWDIKTSVIDSFATFIFLSNVKFLSVSFDLLNPVAVYHLEFNNYTSTRALYYAGNLEYFGEEHRPYAILAVVMLCVFVILPIAVLALYPFNFFQKFLSLFPFRWYILHTFVDSFQGCYKNGTEPGTRDYRWFSVVYFVCRILFLSIYAAARNMATLLTVSLVLMSLAILVAGLKPFKSQHNLINAAFIQLLAFSCLCMIAIDLAILRMQCMVIFFKVLFTLSACVPLLYGMSLLCLCISRNRHVFLYPARRVKAWCRGYEEVQGVEDEVNRFSDRIENPNAYPQENLANFGSRWK